MRQHVNSFCFPRTSAHVFGCAFSPHSHMLPIYRMRTDIFVAYVSGSSIVIGDNMSVMMDCSRNKKR